MRALPRLRTGASRPLAVPVYWRFLGVSRNSVVFGLVVLLTVVLVGAPIVPTMWQSLQDRPMYESGGAFTFENYVKLFTEAGFGGVILNTVEFAVLTTIFALVIAVSAAIVVVKTDVPAKRTLALVMQWPFFVSTLVLSFGWVLVYAPNGFISIYVKNVITFVPWNLYSIPGMALIQAVGLAPLAYVFCANALRQQDSELEAAAKAAGARPWRVVRWVVIPMLRPAVTYSAILLMSFSIETLSVPLIIGRPNGIEVFSTFLYRYGLLSVNPDYGVLGAAALLALLFLGVLVVLQAIVLRRAARFVSLGGKGLRSKPLRLGWLRWPALISVLAYLVIGAIIPLVALVFRSFTTIFTPLKNPFEVLTSRNYSLLLEPGIFRQSIVNSVIVGVACGVLVTTLALGAVLIAQRSPFKGRNFVGYVALAPQALPGLVAGVGLYWAFSVVPVVAGGTVLRTSLLAIVIAFGVLALPIAYSSISPALMQIDEELDGAARVVGFDWLRTSTRILSRLLLPAITWTSVLVFVTVIKEYGAALFVAKASTQVIGTEMLNLWAQGVTGPVSSLAVVQVLICTIAVLVATLGRRTRRA